MGANLARCWGAREDRRYPQALSSQNCWRLARLFWEVQRSEAVETFWAKSFSRREGPLFRWEMRGMSARAHDGFEMAKSCVEMKETITMMSTHAEKSCHLTWANRKARFAEACILGVSNAKSTYGTIVPAFPWTSTPAGCTSTSQSERQESQERTSPTAGSGIRPWKRGRR